MIIKGFVAQGGDILNQDGTGHWSLYGEKFDDEGIWYPHSHKGVLSMANSGPNTNGSQFLICFAPVPKLDKKHTAFGRIINNFNFVK
jgi:cyclophilin family peptidyl-prolyl cis-trans isomerase